MRMRPSLRKIIVSLVLVSILMVVFFSLATMTRGADGGMEGDCPFSGVGATLCPQNLAAAVVHHISAYQSFLAVFATPGTTTAMAAMLALLIALGAALLFSVRLLVYRPPAPASYFSNTPLTTSQDRAVIRWLSLFENSPSRA